LARVAEEGSAPIKLHTNFIKPEKLVEVETPRPSEDMVKLDKKPKSPEESKALESLLEPIDLGDKDVKDNKENEQPKTAETKKDDLPNGTVTKPKTEDDDGMKTIEI